MAPVLRSMSGVGRWLTPWLKAWLAAALLLVLAQALLALPAAAQPLVAVPALSARVTDLTGTLSATQRQQLDTELADLERRKGAQVAILIVPTTQPEAIEQYSIRVAEAWKLGRGRERAQRDTGDKGAAAIDDGVLLVVAKNDRKVRIEVGYGLEGAIPDAIAKRIITEAISPRFRTGDFFGGLQAAVADLSRRIEGEALPAPWQPGQGAEPQAGLLPVVLVAFVIGLVVSQVAGRFVGAAVGGGGAGVTAASALASVGLGTAVGVGVFALILAMGGGRGGGSGGGGGGRLRPVGRRTIGHGPVIVPGGWGGGGGRGGFGGGGFGGGGGGFGGGGASGGW